MGGTSPPVENGSDGVWLDEAWASTAVPGPAHLAALLRSFQGPAFVVTAADLVIVGANAQWFEATLSTPAIVLGRKVVEVFPDDPGEPQADGSRNFSQSIERARTARAPDILQVQRYPVPDRTTGSFEERYWRVISTPLVDNDGSVSMVICYSEDITAAIRERLEYERAETLLRMARWVSQLGGWRMELRTEEVEWTQEAAGFFNMPGRNRVPLSEVLACYREEWREEAMVVTRRAAEMGDPFDIEVQLAPEAGNRWLRIVGEAERDASGSIIALQGAVQDVTARHAREEELARSEARFVAFADALPHIAWMSDPLGVVTFVNAAFYTLVGVENGMPPALFWLDKVHPDDRPRCIEAWQACMATGSDYGLSFRFQRADGEYCWFRVSAVPICDEDGRIVSWYGAGLDIDEMVAAEAQRSQLVQQLSVTLTTISDGFFTVDREYRFLFANQQLGDFILHDASNLVGKNMWDEFPEFYRTQVHELYERAMHDGVPGVTDVYYEPTDRILEVRAFPSSEGLSVYVRDVSIERRAAEASRANEERFRAIAQATADAIWDWDLETGLLWWGDGVRGLFGWDPVELEGPLSLWVERIHPGDRERVASSIEAAVRDNHSDWQESYQFLRKDGTYADVNDRGIVVRDARGHAVRMLGGMTDVTAAHQAERTIREQAALLDEARDAILVRALDNTILYWNRGAENLYGWASEQVVGASIRDLLYRDPSAFEAATRAVIENGSWSGELVQVNRLGEQVVIQARWSLLRTDSGEPRAILAINSDITERKKLEQQFLRAQRMEAIGTLAGGIAHDLNNVLTPIMMSTSLLESIEEDESRRQILHSILASAQQGADMIRQVLTFARGLDGQRIPVNMEVILADVARVAQETFLKTIAIELLPSAGLWRVEGDPTQLQQVLLNLCVNARDAMPEGGVIRLVSRNVTIDDYFAELSGEAQTGPHVVIEVEDTGVGMELAMLDRIFDPFFTTKELGKGTGLGLSTSLAIVKSHGGFIRVYSEPGKGSTFRIYLPARADTLDAPGSGLVAVRELPRGTGELILVVDDESSVLDITRTTLEAFGYRVLTAQDGVAAVSTYASNKDAVRAVITDMMMPVMDGLATIQVLRHMSPGLPIVAAKWAGRSCAGQSRGQCRDQALPREALHCRDPLEGASRGARRAGDRPLVSESFRLPAGWPLV